MNLNVCFFGLPLEDKSKRSNNCGSKGVSIDDEHIVTHSSVEGNFGDDVHSGIAKLERGHGYVWLCSLKKTAHTS